jgi:hypothetical protein
MDVKKAQELSLIADKQIEIAIEYEKARRNAGTAEGNFKILLTAQLKDFRAEKKNLGVDMAQLMLMEENAEARDLFKTWMEQESIYKGLERLLDAYASKLITEQAIMKFIGQGERWG